jgi:hypothetical protein
MFTLESSCANRLYGALFFGVAQEGFNLNSPFTIEFRRKPTDGSPVTTVNQSLFQLSFAWPATEIFIGQHY